MRKKNSVWDLQEDSVHNNRQKKLPIIQYDQDSSYLITSTEDWKEHYKKNQKYLSEHYSYSLSEEHDACGVGFIASLDGRPSRDIVEKGIEALKALWHRGAVDADGKTGDGAGIHIMVPQQFFLDYVEQIGFNPNTITHPLAIGQIFLPRLSQEAQEKCRCIVETQILKFGYRIHGWRQVPINTEVIGEKANATRPEIEQIIVANALAKNLEDFERDLYLIRRCIEKEVIEEQISGFYICSLSTRSLIYKGMFLAEQLSNFYPDLLETKFESNFALYHQRYSTNTFPTWPLAQPFHTLAHNGEINTLRGNINWIKAHEPKIYHPTFEGYHKEIKPVIPIGCSDSMALDAVFELFVRAGRSAPMVKALLIPCAIYNDDTTTEQERALYKYCNTVIEPWDGPAALAAYDGHWIIAGMDRNGLRPLRYTLTEDNLIIVGSETGIIRIPPESIVKRGRIGPGKMIALNLSEGKLYDYQEIIQKISSSQPFEEWIKNISTLNTSTHPLPLEKPQTPLSKNTLRKRLLTLGITVEDVELIFHPMVEEGKEAIGSMGDDTPIAVLSELYRGLHHFFRQNFSQVTNPPIDSLRERYVMNLTTRLGNLGNILDEDQTQCNIIELQSPILTQTDFQALSEKIQGNSLTIDCTFDSNHNENENRETLPKALLRIREESEKAVKSNITHIILSDEMDEEREESRVPIPMILATGAVHTHLLRCNLRTYIALHVRSSECFDVHYTAVLIGVGATTINPYLAEYVILDRYNQGLFGTQSFTSCLQNYKQALDNGLLKIMSKMGISVLSSYRGGCNFEAVGLSRSLVAEHFPSMTSRISGIGLKGIERKICRQHQRAYRDNVLSLPVGSFYRYRSRGEVHVWQGPAIRLLQGAVKENSQELYDQYTALLYETAQQTPMQIRDLLGFRQVKSPINPDEVESITEIRRRFVTPGMSLGALSPEAHGTLNIAMNRIGAKSDSGEGGEDPLRYQLDSSGDNPNSVIKQIASGRFGVNAEYLNQCEEIEIKIAQGAKPGEGGQLPGFKVSEHIALIRHSTPGVTLISPPPHHDIYSIEDLAQLIFDLKQINPHAKVCVKLVARTGIGTIASGVAKAKADVILISGHSGGTGASPQSSIKYAGVPWEMGLSEVHQTLILNSLRHRVTLRVDGGLKTGQDMIIAAILGADEFGVGTASLVAMGCILVRQCHSNTCPVGICTQKEELRQKFTGTPEQVINLFQFIAQEARTILAKLGYRTFNEIIGRTDLLHQVTRGISDLDDLDLNPLLAQPDPGVYPRYCNQVERNPVPDTLDSRIIQDVSPLLKRRGKMELSYTIQNTDRTIGTRLSSMITRQKLEYQSDLRPNHITLRLQGSAGQSLGAFAVEALCIEVTGDANDYVGKGLSGGTIILRPSFSSILESNKNVIIGNTVLYGATGGKLFAAGQAGERFAVRNSGALAVVEGCGTNGCEYMTGGIVVILGNVGDNFAAGMTGGQAFVYDHHGNFSSYINQESVFLFSVVQGSVQEKELLSLIKQHYHYTHSDYAEQLLVNWSSEYTKFWHIVPKEIYHTLDLSLVSEHKFLAN